MVCTSFYQQIQKVRRFFNFQPVVFRSFEYPLLSAAELAYAGADTLSLSQPAVELVEPPLVMQPTVELTVKPVVELPIVKAPAAVLTYSPKPKRVGLHILNKLDLNAMSKDKPVKDPSALLASLPLTTRLYIKRTLPASSPGQLLSSPRHQRAYGSSDLPMNEYEQFLFELNTLLPITGILRVGPYSVPLLVLRFVVDKTGRFLVLVTCPWCPSHNVFSLFHFFKNMLHMLHQMDSDDRLRLLRDFGESQVTPLWFFLFGHPQNLDAAALGVHAFFPRAQQRLLQILGHVDARRFWQLMVLSLFFCRLF